MSKEYISRETAKERLRIWITYCLLEGDNDTADCLRDCIALLDSIPAADVVEVVRCRECKYSHEDEICGNRWCDSHLGCRKVKDDGYCYLGELKEGAGNEP